MSEEVIRANDINKKNRFLFLLLLFLPCVFVLTSSLDNDIWFLLNHGRYVLENGIPHIEPFTIHEGFHFVMQQWLSALIFWLVYSAMGDLGIKILVILCYMILILIIYKLCMVISENYFFISFSVTIFISVIFVFFMVSRPFIFSTPVFALEFYLLESYRARKKVNYLLFLPLLSILLINLQAAMWPMFLIFMVPYIIETFKFKIGPFEGHGVEKKWLYSAMLLSGMAGFINPYRFEAMLYLFKSYGYEHINSTVQEMNPADINTTLGKFVIALIVIVPLLYCSYKKGTKKLRYILLALGTGYMALSSYRNLYLYVMCAFFPLAAYFKDFEPVIKPNPNLKKTRIMRKTLILLILLFIPILFYSTSQASLPENDNKISLHNTLSFILDENKVENVILYTGYNEGNMAEFRGIKTYMDARAEVFVKKNNKKEDIFSEYISMQHGELYYKDVLDKYAFTHLLLTKSDILFTYLQHDRDYAIVYSNDMYTLYESKR